MKYLIIFLLSIFPNASFGQNQFIQNWKELKSEFTNRSEIIDYIYNESSDDAYKYDREEMKKYNELLKVALKKTKLNKFQININ